MAKIIVNNPKQVINGGAKKYYFKVKGLGGLKGDKGDKGDTGAQGLQGIQGLSATVHIGTTTTGEPGTQASVRNSGTESNAVLDFTIPRGDVGSQPELVQTTGTSTTEAMSQNATTEALNNISETKQDKLTAGDNIKIENGVISSTDTTYTAGNGLNLNGTEFSADTNILATKSGLDSYYTKTETDTKLAPKLETEVVTELPTTGEEGKLYLTPKANTTQTATGNPITATAAEEAGKIESFQLDGDTFQQSYTGKNLLKFDPSASGLNGLTVNYDEASGIVRVSGTPTEKWADIDSTTKTMSLKAGSYILSVDNPSPLYRLNFRIYDTTAEGGYLDFHGVDGGNYVKFTLNYDINDVVMRVYIDNNYDMTAVDWSFKIMLESGSDITLPYEPYVGGVPSPNPDYPQPIQTVTGRQTVEIQGKNLLNFQRHSSSWDGASVVVEGTSITFTSNSSGVAGMSFRTLAEPFSLASGNTIVFSRTWLNGDVWERGNFYINLVLYYSDGTSEKMQNSATTTSNYKSEISVSKTIEKDVVSIALSGSAYEVKGQLEPITFGIQLELGSTATAFVPYSKQTYEINLGKNLFDKNAQIVNGYTYASGGSLTTLENCSIQEAYIPVKPSTTYTLHTEATSSQASDFRVYICEYDSGKGFIKRDVPKPVDSSTNTITTTANTHFVRLCFSTVCIDTLQFEAGSTATTYATYFEPIELCKLGDYQDYIWKDGEDWKIHKETDFSTIDSLSDGSSHSLFVSSNNTTRVVIDQCLNGQATNIQAAQQASVPYRFNRFIPKSVYSSDVIGAFVDVNSDLTKNGFVFRALKTEIGTTDAEVEAWLNTHPLEVHYVLATPTDTVITDQTLIAQLEAIRTASLQDGANTITNTAIGSNLAGNMEIGYYGYNPRNRYDKWLWLDINNEYEKIGS